MKYLTKNDLSNGPQLGSQMFQYAGLLALSHRLDLQIIFIREYFNTFRGVRLFETFELKDPVVSLSKIQEVKFSSYHIKNMLYDANVFNIDSSKSWDIAGWFESFHYFDEIKQIVLKAFVFKSEIFNAANKKILDIKSGDLCPVVSVHFRRGDYLSVASLNLSIFYYKKAIDIIYKKTGKFKLLVFSDDIEWCRDNIIGENIHFSDADSSGMDMCMMSLCDHNIIANSTFSWWGAYLNRSKSKIVVCPFYFVAKSGNDHDFLNGQYYPNEWISLSET